MDINFRENEGKISKKITYNGPNSGYVQWADRMWELGWSVPIKDVADMLNVSVSWVNHILLKEVHYTVYSNKYIYNKFKGAQSCLTYIRIEDLNEWIQKIGDFEVQTEIVDLYSYLGSSAKAREALKIYQRDFKENLRYYNPGTLPVKTRNYLDKNFYIYGNTTFRNLSCIRRRDVPFKPIEPFNIFERDLYFASSGNNAETVYREAFLSGDIRVKICGKTIFVKNNRDIQNYKIPFLVPYNANIKFREI